MKTLTLMLIVSVIVVYLLIALYLKTYADDLKPIMSQLLIRA